MRRAARGPGVLIGSQEPDGVGGEAGRLGGTGDLDGRVARLGSKEGLVQRAAQLREKSFQPMRRPSKPSEPQLSTACCQRRTAWYSALESGARRQSEARPAAAEPAPPSRAGFAGGARNRPEGVGRRRDALDPGSRQQARRRTARREGRQRPLRSFQAVAAQGAHVRLQRRGLLRAGGGVAGGKQPVEFLLIKRPSSQRSSRCAARASATWLSGTPSENSKAAPVCAERRARSRRGARWRPG
jgi:hypothetical protein